MAEKMTLEPCKECGSKDTSWSCAPRNNGQAVDGRICMREVGMQFYRGCAFCGETLEVIGADEFLTKLNAHLAQPAQAVDEHGKCFVDGLGWVVQCSRAIEYAALLTTTAALTEKGNSHE